MRWKSALRRLKGDQSGVAAIEMAMVLPVLLILFCGMIDVTALLSDNRRLSYSANTVANLVAKLESPATPAQIADAFKAVELVMKSAQTADVRVDVYNYRKVTTTVPASIRRQWFHTNGTGRQCTAPTTTGLINLMAAGNDVIVIVTCATYTPILSTLTQWKMFGASFPMREQIVVRPRFSLLIDCNGCTP